ncbi:MAG TPA: ABC transporter ATP-binding protein [Solirubrobacteraceae bacterium]|nr:ABC transporter ATP-binding protein [Solirubrobacteraceae bacterium]
MSGQASGPPPGSPARALETSTRSSPSPAGAAEVVLSIRALGKSYGATFALRGVDLEIRRGELLTLLGPSGSGKTTLLKLIAGFEAPSSGRVLLHGRDISRLSPARRGLGMVFQHYALFPHMTVAQNVGYGLKLRRVARAERERRVGEMLALLRLDGLGERYPRQLSGGQQQRVALGRALAYDPEVILMDEPLGALDRSLRIELEEQIRGVHRELGATIVYVTHDQREALALSDRIAVMRDGALAGVGAPAELYRLPPDGFVASFFAAANLLEVQAHELLGDGRARVRCGGCEIACPVTAPEGSPVALAVRRRSLRRAGTAGDLRVAGVVSEMVLLGDEQEIALRTPLLGRIVAVLDERGCAGIALGQELELFAPAQETVLVAAL